MRLLAAIALLALSTTARAEAPLTPIGLWQNPRGTILVRTRACGQLLCGNIAWAAPAALADAREASVTSLIGTEGRHRGRGNGPCHDAPPGWACAADRRGTRGSGPARTGKPDGIPLRPRRRHRRCSAGRRDRRSGRPPSPARHGIGDQPDRSGNRPRSVRHIDLRPMLDDIAEVYGPLAEERGLSIEVDAQAELDVIAHRELLQRALSNLVDNALKYAEGGSAIRIDASIIAGGSNARSAALRAPRSGTRRHRCRPRSFARPDHRPFARR